MFTSDQCKHVVEYCVRTMMQSDRVHITSQMQRDCIAMNKARGEICAAISTHSKYKDIVHIIHDAHTVQQINTVPDESTCAIDGKPIQDTTIGTQLIVHTSERVHHVCIRKSYQEVCYAYFRIRNFLQFVEQYVRQWLIAQPWYIPKYHSCSTISFNVLQGNVPDAIYTTWVDLMDILRGVTD